ALTDRLASKAHGGPEEITGAAGGIWEQFCESMDDDFNTARGIAVLLETVRKMNRLLDESPDNLSLQTKLQSGYADIQKIGNVLGILTQSPKTYFETTQALGLEKKSMDPAVIQQMIDERTKARQTKEWAKADEIRKRLEDMGVLLEDRPEGTIWKIK
ncbi:MAG: cysteine--tRNA ligase, partial [Desulfobacterales bacterium]|nr:cysteine--tRNA ligase [Desulfobacterales bacterium]